MGTDEKAIIDYLQSWPRSFISWREIARKAAGKQRFADEPTWPVSVLAELLAQGVVEKDAMGYYRSIPEAVIKKQSGQRVRRHLSPQILRILTKSGKNFDGVVIDIDPNLSDGIPTFPKPVQNPFLKSDKDNKPKDKGKDKPG